MPKPFLVRLRAYSAAHLAYDDSLWLRWPDAKALLQSEYTGGSDGRAYAVTLHGEIRGHADSLDEAQERLGTALANVLPLFALASNAAVGTPLLVTAHGLDLSQPTPFIWYRTPPASEWFPPGRRFISSSLVHSLMTAAAHHPQTDLVYRAIESYHQALGHWIPEERLLAGEFLFIAAEALSRCIVEQRAADRSMTPKNLARLEGVGTEKALRRLILSSEVFAGDAAALAAMEEASNGFEHGYMTIKDVRGLIDSVLERSMRHVRRALVKTVSPDSETTTQLLSDDFDEPRGLVPVLQIIYGHLRCADLRLPLPEMGSPAVELEWPPGAMEAVRTPTGDLEMKLPANITVAQLPENATLTINGTGLRAANVKSVRTPDVTVIRDHEESDTARDA